MQNRRRSIDQLKKIDQMFGGRRESEIIKVTEVETDKKCNVHRRGSRAGSVEPNHIIAVNKNLSLDKNRKMFSSAINISNNWNDTTRRSSVSSSLGKDTVDSAAAIRRRQSFTEGSGGGRSAMNDRNRKRNSWNPSMFRNIEHPSAFPSLLRSSTPTQASNPQLNVNQTPKPRVNLTRRASLNSLSLNRPRPIIEFGKRQIHGSQLYLKADSSGETNLVRRDSFGSRNLLNVVKGRATSVPRDYVNNTTNGGGGEKPAQIKQQNGGGCKSSILRKNPNEDNKADRNRLTKENLNRHVTILENENFVNHSKARKGSSGSIDSLRGRRMSLDSLDIRRASIELIAKDLANLNTNDESQNDSNRPHFVAVTSLEDVQAVRCAEFHPSGRVYAVGSNSKTFRICEYPSLSEVREEHTTYQPTVLFKRTKHHKGSIYCMGWAPDGELVATGSNDKTIKLMRYDEVKKQLEGREIELTMHDGTVRDLCFLEDTSNKASLLISGGAGDCKIYVTDCATATPFQALSGHGGHILSLYNWGGAMFVSGSQDKTIRFWDLRTRGCVNTITPATSPGTRQGSPVAAVCVDPSGRLLVSGHEDSSCVLYDIRGNRPIQCFKPHSADIRSIRFSPSAYYLLTAGYDNKLVLTDLQGDLTLPLPSVVVAHHTDKVISGRWHPTDFSFLSTSADKTATLWALPPL
ncbi:WD repeat-containing protein 47 isoform X2 [Hermetia illucens]|uniref:WD repeat-containing protein 47 isoform X2 n=1 Tax=Hermetia illucens TaxID=343691 RepID=UPI0018CC6059|nr:WD repeat-containing protein 47 isoform X2 [Hermetia illucens]